MTTDESIEAMRALCNAASRNLAVPGFAYHLVVIRDAGDTTTHMFATVGELVAFIMTDAVGDDDELAAYYGLACAFTPHPVYLKTHEGEFPLFEATDPSAGAVLGRRTKVTPMPLFGADTDVEQSDSDDDDVSDDDDDDDDEDQDQEFEDGEDEDDDD